MRYRLMATYLGVPYHVGLGPDGTEATLFSPAPPPDELGFTAAGGFWRKQVRIADLSGLWQSRLVGEFHGEPCLVLDDLGDRLHIAYLGRDSARARQLGYWEIDREVFEVVLPRHDITRLTEERVDFPLASATFPASAGSPGAGPHSASRPGAAPQGPGILERTSPLRVVPRPAARRPPEPVPSGTPDRAAAWHGSPEAEPWSGPVPPTRRAGRRDRIPESVFAELLRLAAIPQSAYAVDEEVPGAMCLVKTDGGFEVFTRTGDARLDVRFFEDEEAAYFYLFGVLAAEAVRSGRLRPDRVNGHVNGHARPGLTPPYRENVSKYLRGEN
jgi:hypothetical protein